MEDWFFQLFCIVIMWPMLFSVPILYGSSTKEREISDTLTMTTVGLLVAFLGWIIYGYPLSFGAGFSGGDFLVYVLQIQNGDIELILSVVLQACFFLYAAGMFIGTMIHKVKWAYFIVFVPLWLLFIYVPVAFLLWNDQGYLAQLGALDFSGGMVVHVTAGFTSLFLARHFAGNSEDVPERSSDLAPNYLATTLICFGWFGFNLGPLEGIDPLMGMIALNTILAIVGGALGFLLIQKADVTSDDLLAGMVVGLVTSTALVGYTSPIELFLVTLISGSVTCYSRQTIYLDDPVDSFVLNGMGGAIGTIGALLFVHPSFTPDGQTGIFLGGFHSFPLVQLFALFLTILITWVGTHLCLLITNKLFFRKKEISYE